MGPLCSPLLNPPPSHGPSLALFLDLTFTRLAPLHFHWPSIAGIAILIVDLWATCHVVLFKRDSRAAIAWLGFIWLLPVLGPILYYLFGINRIRRRARLLRLGAPRRPPPADGDRLDLADLTARCLVGNSEHLQALARLVGKATGRPLLGGNLVVPFIEPGQACSAMLAAIAEASTSLTLSTYIFDNDRIGQSFLAELQRAMRRGVEVRVLIDGVGAGYSWPSIIRPLRRARIPVALFLPGWLGRSLPNANLRTHRKILVADGRIGFTGGINIREGYCPELRPRHPVEELHFRVEGPVVAQLQEVFSDDWAFCTGEVLQSKQWFPPLAPAGPVFARGIPDGPDEDFEKVRLTLRGGLACARSSVRIITPYFLPDAALIASLGIAAMRGVEVDILLPARGNLPFVQWASTALLWQVLEGGCRVWLSPPPFDHTKLMLVDGLWTLLGSANWDPRSLRLNFELDLECYDRELGGLLESVFQARRHKARPITLADVDGRSLPIKLRDGFARLLSPYL